MITKSSETGYRWNMRERRKSSTAVAIEVVHEVEAAGMAVAVAAGMAAAAIDSAGPDDHPQGVATTALLSRISRLAAVGRT